VAHARFSLPQAISAELVTGAGVVQVLTLLIKLVSGETRLVRFGHTVVVGEGACNGGHAGVRLPLITDHMMLSVHVHAFQDLGNAKFMRTIWQRTMP
jgi:hypothetical protein